MVDPIIRRGQAGIRVARIDTAQAGTERRAASLSLGHLHTWGVLYALVLGAWCLASPSLAPHVPYGEAFPNERAFYEARAWPGGFGGILGGEPPRWVLALCLVLPRALMSVAWVAVFRLILKAGEVSTGAVRVVRGWSVAFAALTFPAVPALFQDFWLSLAWGRMVALGLNPYLLPLDPSSQPALYAALPLDQTSAGMTYGPLWALLSGGVMAVAGDPSDHLWAGVMAFRLVLVAAWLGLIVLIDRLVADRSPRERALGLLIIGWLPVGVVEALAEGHNDVVLMCAVVLWMAALWRSPRSWWARIALAVSIGVKYVTLPLLVLDWLWGRHCGVERRALALRLAVAGLVLLVGAGVFWHSTGIFDSGIDMLDWHFLTPSEVPGLLERLLGRAMGTPPWPVLSWAARGIFVGVAWVALRRLRDAAARARRSGEAGVVREAEDRFRWTAGWFLAAVPLSLVGHLWPWFFLWVLAPAATSPASSLGRFAAGLGLALPFAICWIQLSADAGGLMRLYAPSVLLYGWLAVWWRVSRNWWPRGAADGPSGTFAAVSG